MTMMGWQVTTLIFAVIVAFMSSAWVNAVSRLSKGRALSLQSANPKPGKLLVKIAENPPPYLTGSLLLMLVARVTATVLATVLVMRSGWPAPTIIAIVLMSFVLFQLAEVAPRTWVLERLDQVLLLSARPVFFVGSVLKPVSMFLLGMSKLFLLILPGRGLPRGPLTSEEEIKSILDVAESEEVIEAEEREMIHSIFEFGDTVVREVMVPRPDMVCVQADERLQGVLDLALKKGFSRIPVIGENIDDLRGIIFTKDVMKKLQNGAKSKAKTAEDLKREATFVPESKKVAELLREMQKTKTHMVVVVDEYGGTAGLATMEDLLEEIVGEISDEYDREEPPVEALDEGLWRVNARLDIDSLNQILGAEFPNSNWDSVGGLVGGTLGRVASDGDVIVVQGFEFEVERMKGRRIEKLLVRRGSSRDD